MKEIYFQIPNLKKDIHYLYESMNNDDQYLFSTKIFVILRRNLKIGLLGN